MSIVGLHLLAAAPPASILVTQKLMQGFWILQNSTHLFAFARARPVQVPRGRLPDRPPRLHQSYIAVLGSSFFGNEEKGGGVVLWLHENYIGFFLSYIRDGSLERGPAWGWVACPYTPGVDPLPLASTRLY